MQDSDSGAKKVSIEGDEFDPKKLGGSIKRGIVNPNLVEERAKRNFDGVELEELFFGKMVRDKIHKISDFIDRTPEVRTPMSWYHMTREQKMEESWRRFNVIMKDDEMSKVFTENSDFSENHFEFCWSYMFPSSSLLHLHQTMFTRCLMTFSSEEQRKKYLKRADYLNITGCYAQTEVGHGSNVAGLETTATLDMETDEFVIHTPTITATKFWPGSLGVVSTHAVVFARCLANGNDYGVQPFIV
jgi:hypothetical protein